MKWVAMNECANGGSFDLLVPAPPVLIRPDQLLSRSQMFLKLLRSIVLELTTTRKDIQKVFPSPSCPTFIYALLPALGTPLAPHKIQEMHRISGEDGALSQLCDAVTNSFLVVEENVRI